MFANTNYDIVNRARFVISDIIGKQINIYQENVKNSSKIIFRVKLSPHDAVNICRNILPHLIEKRTQADSLIRLQKLKKPNKFKKRSKLITDKMENLYQFCKNEKIPHKILYSKYVGDIGNLDIGWLSGLIDTEGAIYLFRHHRTKYVSCVTITNTSYGLIAKSREIIEEILGRQIEIMNIKKENRRRVFIIRLLGENAAILCKTIIPYLIAKKKQAKAIIEIQKLKRKQHKRPYPIVVSNKMNEIYYSLRVLNKRG